MGSLLCTSKLRQENERLEAKLQEYHTMYDINIKSEKHKHSLEMKRCELENMQLKQTINRLNLQMERYGLELSGTPYYNISKKYGYDTM